MYTSDVCNEIFVVCDNVMLKKKSINTQINSEALQPATYSVKKQYFYSRWCERKSLEIYFCLYIFFQVNHLF